MILAALAGAFVGLGIIVIAAGLRPAPARLDAVLARLDGTETVLPGRSLQIAIGGWLTARFARPAGLLPVPRADLALLGRPVERFMAAKLILALTTLLSVALTGALLGMLGLTLPWPVPAAVSVAVAAAMFWFPDLDIHSEAARRRADFRHAFTAYLQLVRLGRAAGAGSTEALEYAARLGSGWVFSRIAAVLDQARRSHEPPWKALSGLGAEIGVEELADLASIAEIAGNEGARIGDTLRAATESLRGRTLSAARAKANSRTTTMIIPLTLLGLGFVLLLAFPAFYALITVK